MTAASAQNTKMVDIHMHLVPGADDGAEDMRMARVMLIEARSQGIYHIFATPHSSAFDDSEAAVKAAFRQLSENTAAVYPDTVLYSGCEVYCEEAIMDRVVAALDRGTYPTMNHTRCVLMEFSLWVGPEGTLPCVQALIRAGYKPIIAHMERYQYLRGNMELVDRLRSLGCLIQINSYDLFDETDDAIRNWARRLVLEQKADFLGTDAHRTYYRPPSAAMGLDWIYQNAPPEYADALAFGNARQLLQVSL